MDGYDAYQGQYIDPSARIADLEEKQRILRERLLLIGQNLIEHREETAKKFLELRKEMEIMKESVERLIGFLETASQEFSKFARKEDVEILAKQARMFQPLRELN